MTDEIVKGFKATDKNMQCRGFQFELGVWHKHNGEIEMCESGFHFCEYPSGPWSFYRDDGTRIFKVEARGVIRGEGPGADLKHVAMEICLVEEVSFDGDRNTGDWNTGNGNATDKCSGYLCCKEQPVIIFDKKVKAGFDVNWPLVHRLSGLMMSDDPIDCSKSLSIPNASETAIKKLHKAHIDRRKAIK